jgi:hypothetical protein
MASKKEIKVKRKRREAPRKVSDKDFYAILRENAGLFARTARAIAAQFNIPYTRMAVKDRADKHPEIMDDIEQENLDIAEEGLNSLMRSKAENIRLDSVKFYLKTKGRKRGYVEKQETDITIKKLEIPDLTNLTFEQMEAIASKEIKNISGESNNTGTGKS